MGLFFGGSAGLSPGLFPGLLVGAALGDGLASVPRIMPRRPLLFRSTSRGAVAVGEP